MRRSDIPPNGVDGFEYLAGTAPDAERQGKRRHKKSAGRPREKSRRVAGDQQTDGEASVGDGGDNDACDPDGRELSPERALRGEDERGGVEASFSRSHLRPNQDGPDQGCDGYTSAHRIER